MAIMYPKLPNKKCKFIRKKRFYKLYERCKSSLPCLEMLMCLVKEVVSCFSISAMTDA